MWQVVDQLACSLSDSSSLSDLSVGDREDFKQTVTGSTNISNNHSRTRNRKMYKPSRYSTVQYSTIQYSTVQYSTVKYSTVQEDVQTQQVVRC